MTKLVSALALAALTLTATPAEAAVDRTPRCNYEDGSGQGERCVWDARHMGNGRGHSLLIINGGEDNARYIRITHRRAHRLATTKR